MPLSPRPAIACLLLLGAVCLGCSDDKTTRLSGTITLDGTPLEKGKIRFDPVDGNAPTAETLVADGKYSVITRPGKKNVIINGMKKVGERRYHEEDPTSPIVDVNEETVPARYNTASELTAELKGGAQTLNWELTTNAP
jgi:hypothetical protein